jgi:hypothetical protein
MRSSFLAFDISCFSSSPSVRYFFVLCFTVSHFSLSLSAKLLEKWNVDGHDSKRAFKCSAPQKWT